MKCAIPSAAAVRALLSKLTSGQFAEAVVRSGVPRSTAFKIRSGITPNPGIDTARALFHAAEKVRRREPAESAS